MLLGFVFPLQNQFGLTLTMETNTHQHGAIDSTIKNQVSARVAELIQIANLHFNIDLTIPKIRYAIRGASADEADAIANVVNFNPTFLCHNTIQFIREVVGHEIAHIVSLQKFGMHIYYHDIKWQQVMKLFGLEPIVTHQCDLRVLKNFKHLWICKCNQHIVPKHVHYKLLSGVQYVCDNCNSDVILHKNLTI